MQLWHVQYFISFGHFWSKKPPTCSYMITIHSWFLCLGYKNVYIYFFRVLYQYKRCQPNSSDIMLFPTVFLLSTRHNSWYQRNTSLRFALQEMLTCQQIPPQASFCPSLKHFRNQIDWSWYQIMTPSPSYFFYFFKETFFYS